MIVLLDVDGVIADFEGAFLKVANLVTGREVKRDPNVWDLQKACDLTPEEIARVWVRVNEPGFAATFEPLPGAVKGVKSVASVAFVYFVTSPVWSSPTWTSDRTAWLKQYFGNDLGGNVIHTRHKHMVHGHVFVDDKPQNVKDWQATWHKGVGIEWPFDVRRSQMENSWGLVREAALRMGGTHV